MKAIYYLCDHKIDACGDKRMCWSRYRLCSHTTDRSHAYTPEAERRFIEEEIGFWEVTNERYRWSPDDKRLLNLLTQKQIDEIES